MRRTTNWYTCAFEILSGAETILKVLLRLLLIAGVGAGLWFAIHSLQAKKQAELAAFAATPRPAATVAAIAARSMVWTQYIPALGAINATQEVDVTGEVAGKITQIHFQSGQKVDQGDVLLELDTSVAAAQLKGLIAEQKLASLNFERSKKLRADRTISQSEYDIAAARVDETNALVLAQRAMISQKTIRAPFSGQLGIRAVDVGEYLDKGMKIVSLRALDPIYVDFAIPERYFRHLSIGQKLTFTVQAYPDQTFEATLRAIEPGIDTATRNVRLRAATPNPDEVLRPGMFAEISLTTDADKSVLVIPETAVDYTPYGNSVFVIEQGDGGLTVQRTQIETGDTRDGQIAVVSGLEENQRIVALGHNKLRNGMPVKIDAQAPLGITQ